MSRWFELSELGKNPEAPKTGDLVWVFWGRTKKMPEMTLTLDRWEWEGAEHWRVREQAFKSDLNVGDLVQAVVFPEPPEGLKITGPITVDA